MNATLQWLVVGVLLGWSVWAMLARLAPGVALALREQLARAAAARGRDGLAARLREIPAAAGCDSGCASCKTGCAAPAPAPAPVPVRPDSSRPVQWR